MRSIKKKSWVIIVIIILALLNVVIFNRVGIQNYDSATLEMEVNSTDGDSFQIFFKSNREDQMEGGTISEYTTPLKSEKLVYEIPLDTTELRIDLGTIATHMSIESLKVKYLQREVDLIAFNLISKIEKNDIGNIEVVNDKLRVETVGKDPYIILKDLDITNLTQLRKIMDIMYKSVICLAIDVVVLAIYKIRRRITQLISELWRNKRLIINLAVNDFKTKYAGSYLGITWAFIQPMITIFIYWFVFQIGFRTPPVGDYPYLLWLIVGLIPWFVYSDAISNAAYSLIEYNYLVKKVVFKISILPVVKVLSAFFVHLFFIVFGVLVFMFYGKLPDVYMLQIFYYAFCMFFIILGTSYATSAIILFFKDLSQIINIILQITMWMTPILWNQSILTGNLQWIFELNPIFYIIQGYRDCFINKVWFWERAGITIYFWMIAIGIFMLGSILFKKLKIHFADVL